jgi:hypothetical protein
MLILIFSFTQYELPLLKCSEEDCLADFVLRKDARLNNLGACSLEFQSFMQILIEHMLKWDTNTKTSTGKEIPGTVRAFSRADEEQGRKTLHRHWQILVEEINQHYEMLCLTMTIKQGTKLDKLFNNTLTML